MKIEKLNAAQDDELRQGLLGCCGSDTWVRSMIEAHPFNTIDQLHRMADRAFDRLDESDWLEAFAAHPKLGDLDSLRMKFAGNKQWSAGEQSGVQEADRDILKALAEGNVTYEQQFGFIFILCATGVSAEQMLNSLNERLINTPEQELLIAAEQQRRITHLRIDKWIAADPDASRG